MLQVSAGNVFAYLDYAVIVDRNLLLLSVFHRSSMAVAGLCANVGLENESTRIIEHGDVKESFSRSMETENYHTKVQAGRETISHGVCISRLINTEYIFIQKETWQEELYSYLMNQFELPLLREWVPYLTEEAYRKKLLIEAEIKIIGSTQIFQKFRILQSTMTNDDLKEMVRQGLATKTIRIAQSEQQSLDFANMDDYFQRYGHTLVDNLEKLLRPLSPMKEIVSELAFVNKRLYPQQAAIVNGAMECLNYKNYAFLVESMGSGKTFQGMGIVDGWFNKKYLKQHPKLTTKDLYLDGNLVKYRTIIMCPSHLVEKWEKAIRDEVPYARVSIINDLQLLILLRRRGKECLGKEYYILSKDSGKLSYSYAPVPYQLKYRNPKIPVCENCGNEYPLDLSKPCKCGGRKWKLEEELDMAYGLICPECGELLLPVDGKHAKNEDTGEVRIMQPEDFSSQTTANHFCRCCGAMMWTPSSRPVDDRIMFQKPKPKAKKWKKISHFTNRAKKARKSVWVMDSREEIYRKQNKVTKEEIEEMEPYGPRRFAPTRYIKKYMKNFFNLAIFDEVQEYKSGGSAQGFSMHDLIKASKKQLALTGTIAGGYASDLFYTLFRLDPARMIAKGYNYGNAGERKFVEKYGTLETIYEVAESGEYHSMSRGKVITPTRCLPGISVLIFTEFLLDTALFLDLSDLSRFLPKLYENVVFVPLEEEIRQEYSLVRKSLKEYMKKEKKGSLLMGSFLQFSLSYSDMPYRREPIVSPENGEVVVESADLSYLVSEGKLLNKEWELINIVQEELREGRNCFIYCEFTGEGEEGISYRLKEVLEQHCGLSPIEVIVLESSYPAAIKREEWIHQKAAEGMKVCITNAKCVATGLDFAFEYHSRFYNYPTIIFYQIGYDMIKIWQASHRHYRLNQPEECRTYYIMSEYTIQPDAVELVATKEVATSSIQGQFSSEGLSAMARGVDPRVILAQSVAEKSDKKERGLRKMMDVLNDRNNKSERTLEYEKMPTFAELTGLSEVPALDDPLSQFERVTGKSILDLLGLGLEEKSKESVSEQKEQSKRSDVAEITIEAPEEPQVSIIKTVHNPESAERKELLELLDFIF